MENGDDWLAPDKLQHVLFCFLISIFFSSLCNWSQYAFLRRWSISIGSLASLIAGAAKEAADEIGLWKSSGASLKDMVADLIGISMASLSFSFWKRFYPRRNLHETGPIRGASMV